MTVYTFIKSTITVTNICILHAFNIIIALNLRKLWTMRILPLPLTTKSCDTAPPHILQSHVTLPLPLTTKSCDTAPPTYYKVM